MSNKEYNVNNSELKKSAYLDTLENLGKTYLAKNSDYGDSFGEIYDEYGIVSALVRMEDKFMRLKNLTLSDKDQEVLDESIDDTLLDLANYCIMTYVERILKPETKTYEEEFGPEDESCDEGESDDEEYYDGAFDNFFEELNEFDDTDEQDDFDEFSEFIKEYLGLGVENASDKFPLDVEVTEPGRNGKEKHKVRLIRRNKQKCRQKRNKKSKQEDIF